jgi:hypothetical protein
MLAIKNVPRHGCLKKFTPTLSSLPYLKIAVGLRELPGGRVFAFA